MLDKLLQRLPDTYDKSPDSNVGKLLTLPAEQLDNIEDNLDRLQDWRDIDKAEGKVLDRIGRNVNLPRGRMSDLEYRRMIKLQIIINQSRGNIETINQVANVLLQDSFIDVKEYWQEEVASLILAYDYFNLFDEVSQEYEEIESDPWYLDGTYNLDGERLLDGGIEIDAETKLEDVINIIEMTSQAVERALAGGIKLYFRIPFDLNNTIEVNQSLEKTVNKSLDNEITISQKVDKTINKSVMETPTNYLDGSFNLDGSWNLDSERDRIEQRLKIEVV